MKVVLPFTCQQLNNFGDRVATYLKWVILIGSPILLGYGILLGDQIGVIWIVLGACGTILTWLISLAMWTEDGTLSCKMVNNN